MKTCRYYLALAFCVLCQFFCSETASGQFKADNFRIWSGRDRTTDKEESDLKALLHRIAPNTVARFNDDDDMEFFLNTPLSGGAFPSGVSVHTILSLIILAEKAGNPAEFVEYVQYYEKRGYTSISTILQAYSPQGSHARSVNYKPPLNTGQDIDKKFQELKSAIGLVPIGVSTLDPKDLAVDALKIAVALSSATEVLDKIVPASFAIRWSLETISTGIDLLTEYENDRTADQIAKYKLLFFAGKILKSPDGTRQALANDEQLSFSADGWLSPLPYYPSGKGNGGFWDYVDFMLWVGAIFDNDAFQDSFGSFLTKAGSSGNPTPKFGISSGNITEYAITNQWIVYRGETASAYVSFGEGFYSRCKKVEVTLRPEDGTELPKSILITGSISPTETSVGFTMPSIGAGQTTQNYKLVATLTYDQLDGDGDAKGEYSTTIEHPLSIYVTTPILNGNYKPIASSRTFQVAHGGSVTIPLNAYDPDGKVIAIEVNSLPSHSVVGSGNRIPWKNYFEEVQYDSTVVVYRHNGSSATSDSFTFVATDDDQCASAPATISIQVVGVPSNPAIVTQSQVLEVPVGKSIPVNLTGGSTVSGNITHTVTTAPTSGQITQVVPGDNEHLIYTAPTTTGTQTMTYRVQDGAGNQSTETIQIKVVPPVAHTPKAANVAVSVSPGKSASFKLNGSDVDGPTLSYQIIKNPSYGSVTGTAPNLTYTHNPANGTSPDTLEYRVTDPTGRSATAFVNLKIANTPPVIGALINRAAAVGQSVSATLTATDTTGQVISYHLAPGSPGTINANQWSHTFSTAGDYTVTILARDRANAGSPVLSESTKSFTVIVGGYARFTDVPPTHPHYVTIHDAAKTRGFVGYTEGTQLVFKPDQPITRGEFMTLLLKYSEVPVDTSGTPFPDVPSSHTHFAGIQTFKNRSVVIGFRSGSFGPDDYLERQEMAVIFTNILRWGWGDFPSAPFVDVPVPPPNGLTGYQWDPIYNAINQLKEHGLTSAANLYYRPFENATRVEAVIMMDRYLGQAVAGGVGQDGYFTYFDNGTSITITGYPKDAVGAVEIPASINGKPVTSIGSRAFSLCFGLTSVTIPNSVTSIEDSAFIYCYGLTSVTIPNSVTSIEDDALSLCAGLTEITVDAGNPAYSSADGVLFDKNQTILVKYPGGKTGSYVIPSSVASIGSLAFHWCTGLTSVTIPPSVTSIERGAFHWCTGLTSVTIPSSVTSIGNYAFHSCTTLIGVMFEGNAPSMDTYAEGNAFFGRTASGFTVYYYSVNTGFTSPAWLGYPAQSLSPTADSDHDGIPNLIELVIGGSPIGTSSDSASLPTGARVRLDPDGAGPAVTGEYFRFSHRRTQASVDVGVTTTCEYTPTLQGEWTDATHASDVVKTVTPGGIGPEAYDTIDYFIPIQGSNPTVFARLKAVVP